MISLSLSFNLHHSIPHSLTSFAKQAYSCWKELNMPFFSKHLWTKDLLYYSRLFSRYRFGWRKLGLCIYTSQGTKFWPKEKLFLYLQSKVYTFFRTLRNFSKSSKFVYVCVLVLTFNIDNVDEIKLTLHSLTLKSLFHCNRCIHVCLCRVILASSDSGAPSRKKLP